nr:aminoacyl-histidine dipeptidase [Lachnospiraceae bacterium]
KVFYYFEQICNIPHGSYHEKAISDYLKEFAKERGITCYQDDLYNIIMLLPASKGRENEEPVILQGHMDMVCEPRPGSGIDMEKEGLQLEVEGDWISAKDTTLGGDDGIAVAYMLAIADDPSVSHPPLEYVITVSEEVGMEGAVGIDLSMLKGRTLINIDSEDEGIFTVSCAGGLRADATIPVKRQQPKNDSDKDVYELVVSGLLGGHSGCEIDKKRANANMLMGRALYALSEKCEIQLFSLEGGNKDNAIPIRCRALIGIKKEDQAVAAEQMEKVKAMFAAEYAATDKDISVTLKEMQAEESKEDQSMQQPLTAESLEKVTSYLMSVPNGIQNMSASVEGLVETSLNLGVLKLEEESLIATHSVRSSVTTRKEYVAARLSCLAKAFGGSISIRGDYPAWEYKEDSKLRDKVILLYREMYGKEPVVEGIHAGLECGILASKLPGLDAVSMGPDMRDIHTFNEKLSISSTERVYRFLLKLLA